MKGKFKMAKVSREMVEKAGVNVDELLELLIKMQQLS
jgi:ferritin-like protein